MISAHTDALRTPTHATDHARGGEAPARSEHAALTLQIILQNAATYIPYVCSPLLPRSLFLTMPRCGAVQHPIIFNVRARIARASEPPRASTTRCAHARSTRLTSWRQLCQKQAIEQPAPRPVGVPPRAQERGSAAGDPADSACTAQGHQAAVLAFPGPPGAHALNYVYSAECCTSVYVLWTSVGACGTVPEAPASAVGTHTE